MNTGRLIVGIFIISIGLSALFDLNIIKYIWAILLIFLGYKIITGKQGHVVSTKPTTVSDDVLNEVTIFGEINKTIQSNAFAGGKLVAIFGGGEVDLSQVKPVDKELNLELVAILGGMRVFVPNNWKVKTEGVGIIGGFDNKTTSTKHTTTLRVTGAAILGGIEILGK